MPSAVWTAATVVQVFSSSMSFISSSIIVCKVAWPSNGGFSTPFRRIIFGLSFSDVLQSFALVSGPWMTPSWIGDGIFWGIGNKATCQANGFLFTIGSTAVGLYTCLLCLYYLAKLKWKMGDKTFWHKYEKKSHLFIIIYRIAIGVAALRLDVLHTAAGATACGAAVNPFGCRFEPELVGECTNNRSIVNAFIFFDVMLALVMCFVFVLVSMIRLVLHADFLKKLNDTEKDLSASEDSSSHDHFAINIDTVPNDIRNTKTDELENKSPSDAEKKTQSTGNALRESQSTGKTQLSRDQEYDNQVIEVERRARAHAARDLSQLYFNETMLQAKLYVGSFIITYIPVVFILIAIIASGASANDSSLIVTVLTFYVMFFYPLGGLLNILVYSRPKVASLRRLHPEISRLKAFWMAFKTGEEVDSGENSPMPSSDSQLTTKNSKGRKRNISNSTKDPFGVARIVPPPTPTATYSRRGFVNSDIVMDGMSETFDENDPRYTRPSDWSYEEGGQEPDLNFTPSSARDIDEGQMKRQKEIGLRRGGRVSQLLSGFSFFSEETKNNDTNVSFASRDMALDSGDWQSETQSV